MSSPTDPPDYELFATPEEAALAGWRSTPAAHAQVVSVERNPLGYEGVWVTIATKGHPGFHDRDISDCRQTVDGRWYEVASFGG